MPYFTYIIIHIFVLVKHRYGAYAGVIKMKRILSLLLALTIVSVLSACKKENTSYNTNTSTTIQTEMRSTNANHMQTSETDTTDESSGDTETPSSNTSTQTTNSTENNSGSTPSANINPTHTHSFSAATCTEPKKCSCGATEGSALGHKWNKASCTNPKTCNVCKVTDGDILKHTFRQGICSICGAKDANYIPLKNSVFYKTFLEKDSEGYEIGYMYCLSFGKKQKGNFTVECVEGIDLETAYNLKWFEGDSVFNSMSIDDIAKKITEANIGDKCYREYFYVGDKMYLPWAGGGPYCGESVEMNDFRTVFNDYRGIGRLEYIYDGNDDLEITSFVFEGDDINDGVFSVGDRYIRITSETKQNYFAY